MITFSKHHSICFLRFVLWQLEIVSDFGFRASNLFLLGFLFISIPKKVFQLVHKFLDIFKLSIDRGEADVCDSIQPMKLLHHLLADLSTLDLSLPFLLKVSLDAVNDLFNQVDTNRSLFTCLFQAIEDFEAVEDFSPPVFLDYHGKGFLCPLAGGKSFVAAETFPPPPDRLFVLAEAGVNHFTL